jgi:RimJ/RimL family protein N-acetyltransferase
VSRAVVVATERLILRPWTEADRAPFRDLCASPAVMEFLGGPWSAERVDASIDRHRACQEAHGHCFWAIERKEDGAFLGFCGLRVDYLPGTPIADDVEIGWRLAEHAWGRGYAREAAAASLAWAWANLAVARVVAITVPANVRSWGLMERLGMVRDAALDFDDPEFFADHPHARLITYVAHRPVASAA